MEPTSYHVIGIMSGTSRAGIDLAEVKFNYINHAWHFTFGITKTLAYSDYWRKTLAEADTYSPAEIETLNKTYTAYLGMHIKNFIDKHQLENLQVVCIHSHTVIHQPEKQYTLQIGNLPELAETTDQSVICDFRVQDVQLGGQGAPLVPIGDHLLFEEFVACINLGGFANISLAENDKRIAYDICPVNIVLNKYAEEFGLPYDDKGKIARSGKVNHPLLKALNELEFYKANSPKSLGIEWVKKEIFPLLNNKNISTEDILTTYTAHVSDQLASALRDFSKEKILLTGGGVYNEFLIQSLKNKTDCELVIPNAQLTDYKEALIFGLLGVLKLRGEVNVLKSVTGAKKDHSSGIVLEKD